MLDCPEVDRPVSNAVVEVSAEHREGRWEGWPSSESVAGCSIRRLSSGCVAAVHPAHSVESVI